MTTPKIRLLLSDVDGTLVPSDKTLTRRTMQAVHNLREAGIIFAITSARPPRGLTMFIEPLELSTPLGALNGGLVVDRDLRVIKEQPLDEDVAPPVIDLLHAHGMSVWVYQGEDWFVLDKTGPHVEREASITELDPIELKNFDQIDEGAIKVVGVSDDDRVATAASTAVAEQFARDVTATRSQTYYLDVTHPLATKGSVVELLSTMYDVPTNAIATIGDMHNDVSMFLASGFSVAMGNADHAVQRFAHRVTTSNNDEGFANAVDDFILR